MLWESAKTALKSQEGQTRVVTKFLWFPVCLPQDGKDIWRWLERADVIQEVRKVDIGGSMQYGYYGWYWCNSRWVAE